jgi:hypothetical protein
VRRELEDARKRLPKLLTAAQGQSRVAFRSAAAAEVATISRLLREAEIANERLRAIASAADVAFPWASREAQEFGHRAGLPDSIAFAPLVFDPHAQNNSPAGTWFKRMAEAGLLEREALNELHAGPRAAHVERVNRAAARVDPMEQALAARKAQLLASGEFAKMVRERSPRYRVVGTGRDARTVQVDE